MYPAIRHAWHVLVLLMAKHWRVRGMRHAGFETWQFSLGFLLYFFFFFRPVPADCHSQNFFLIWCKATRHFKRRSVLISLFLFLLRLILVCFACLTKYVLRRRIPLRVCACRGKRVYICTSDFCQHDSNRTKRTGVRIRTHACVLRSLIMSRSRASHLFRVVLERRVRIGIGLLFEQMYSQRNYLMVFFFSRVILLTFWNWHGQQW